MISRDAIAALDRARSPGQVMALTRAEGFTQPSTRQSPRALACDDGRVYWVKSASVRGLDAELVCGRLGALIHAAPLARPVLVTAPAIASLEDRGTLVEGVGVGSQHVPGAENARDLSQRGQLTNAMPANLFNIESYARALALRAWLGVRDAQVLVTLTSGVVLSIDHEDACDSGVASAPAAELIGQMPAAANEAVRAWAVIEPAVRQIEAVTDTQIMTAVANIPTGPGWNDSLDDRYELACWIAARRGEVRGALHTWSRQ